MFQTDNLRYLLSSVLRNSATEREVTELVRIAYEMALVRLKQLVHSGRLHLQSFSISLEGAAFDSIGELFRRDSEDGFVELKTAFSGEWDIDRMDSAGTAMRFRSLVFNSVQKGIIRLYKEYDPVFSRILRNLRLAIKGSNKFSVFERLGMQCVRWGPEDQMNSHLTEYPIEQLDSVLAHRIRRWDSTSEFLQTVCTFLNQQSGYRQFLSLHDLALLMKRHMVRERVPVERLISDESDFLQNDIQSIIHRCLGELEDRFRKEYGERGKIGADLLTVYCQAIGNLIMDVFARNDGQSWSQPDYLEALIPGLTRDEYRRVHRTHFEYMVRVARKHVGERLKELL